MKIDYFMSSGFAKYIIPNFELAEIEMELKSRNNSTSKVR
jgi:hypothetical protein